MRLPAWLFLAFGIFTCAFGVYRIWLAMRPEIESEDARPKRGIYAMRKRTHMLVGIVYLLLGGPLTATSFGWNPLGNMFGPQTTAPSKDTAPSKAKLPADQLPPSK